MDGAAVIAAYHDLWRVEQSFRMTKSDLRAQPVFHHQREAIEAHLTVVFAALAVARYLQNSTGISIKKIIQTLRAQRSATIEISGQRLTPPPTSPTPPETYSTRSPKMVTKPNGTSRARQSEGLVAASTWGQQVRPPGPGAAVGVVASESGLGYQGLRFRAVKCA